MQSGIRFILKLLFDLYADCGGKRCDNGLADELDEEAEVEDPAEDLDDPREESESDSLGGRV